MTHGPYLNVYNVIFLVRTVKLRLASDATSNASVPASVIFPNTCNDHI